MELFLDPPLGDAALPHHGYSYPHQIKIDEKYKPFHFSGEVRVNSTLVGGTSKDFNVFTDRRFLTAKTQFLAQGEGKFSVPFDANVKMMYFYIVKGSLSVQGFESASANEGELLFVSPSEGVQGSPPPSLELLSGPGSEIIQVCLSKLN